jgi:carbon storage regulator CsrA
VSAIARPSASRPGAVAVNQRHTSRFFDTKARKVIVLRQQGGKLHIGVEAPDNVAVHKEEIYQRTKREQRAAGAHRGTVRLSCT